jgi:hypothetical protein
LRPPFDDLAAATTLRFDLAPVEFDDRRAIGADRTLAPGQACSRPRDVL